MPALNTPIKEVHFTILDTETTGVNPGDGHGIIEIGMTHFSGGEIGDSFETLLRPPSPQTAEALSTHRISPASLEAAPSFAETAGQIIGFIGETVIAAHNLHFDMMFLDTSLRRIGRPPLPNPAIDTILLSQEIWPDYACHCLRCLGPALDLGRSGTHRALDDVMATAGLLGRIIEELNRDGRGTLEDLHPVRKDFTWETGDVYRKLRMELTCAIRRKVPVELILYNKDECFYSRETILPVRLENDVLAGHPPGKKENVAYPIYNIIAINPGREEE